MTPMTPLGVKPQLWLIVWLGPPKTPNGPPRGALCCTHRTQGNIHFFLLQWNIGGPEWPPNDPHDPPNKFAMFLGSNCAPQWGNKKFHDLVTVILSGNYLYAMLSKIIFWQPGPLPPQLMTSFMKYPYSIFNFEPIITVVSVVAKNNENNFFLLQF